jgi:transcriptional regulator with XRE-family HTH domain
MRKSTHTPEYAALRERLAAIRAGAGLSQRQVAAAMRLPHSWVAKVESGERRIDLVEFGWFCRACGVDAAQEAALLFDGAVTRRAARGRGAR